MAEKSEEKETREETPPEGQASDGDKTEGAEDDSVYKDPKRAKDLASDLRSENARRRQNERSLSEKNKDLSSRLKKFEEESRKRQEEDGKYKDLYEGLKGKADRVDSLEEQVKTYETVFQKELEGNLKQLTKAQREIIVESGQSVSKQLEMSRKLLAEVGKKKDGPGSERPGDGMTLNTSEFDKIYQDTNKLLEIKEKDPSLYDRIIKHVKGKEI